MKTEKPNLAAKERKARIEGNGINASLFLCVLCVLLRLNLLAQVPPTNAIVPATRAVMTDSNSVLKQPTNFFAANSNLLNAAVSPGGTNGALLNANNLWTGNNTHSNTTSIWTNSAGQTFRILPDASMVDTGLNAHIGANQTNAGNTSSFGGGPGQTMGTNNGIVMMGPTNIATNDVGVAILGAGLTVNNKTNEAVFGVPAAFIEATNNKLNVTGTLTGSGSGLTSLNAANLNGQVPFANGGSAASSQAGFITAAFGTTNFTDNSFAPGLPTNTASGNFVDQLSLTTGSGARWLRYWTGGAWGNNFTFGPNAMIFFATDNNELFWASNGVDNCMELRNFDPAHFSAVRFVDAAGNETGAVGYGNTNALIYADMDYFESFGLQKPIYFVAGGGVIGGMAKTTGDFIWNDNNTNAFFWVRRSDKTVNLTNGLNVSGTIRAGTGAAGGGSSGGRGVTLSTGYLDSADFDPSEGGVVAHDSAHVHGTNFVSNVRNTLAAGPISFDASGAGSGMNYETSSPGGIAMLTFGISSAYCFCTTSAAQGWGGFPSVDIGTDIANGNTIGNAMLKPHGSFGTDTKSKGTNYTATMGDSVLLLNVSAKTITLPDATSHCAGRIYTVKLTVSGTGTVATTSSQNIDGATTYSLSAQYKYVTVQSDGTQWWIIANN